MLVVALTKGTEHRSGKLIRQKLTEYVDTNRRTRGHVEFWVGSNTTQG